MAGLFLGAFSAPSSEGEMTKKKSRSGEREKDEEDALGRNKEIDYYLIGRLRSMDVRS